SDRLEVWNPGQLPPPLTLKALRAPHPSIPHNPLIAEPLFLTRYIEKAGTGILDMIKLCKAAGVPTPQFRQDGGQFIQILRRPPATVTAQVTTEDTEQDKQLWDFALRDIARVFQMATAQVTAQVAAQVALFCREPKSAREIMEHLQLKHWKTFQENYLIPLIQDELLERTIPDKPTSRLQKYRLTEKGRAWLAGRKP
ncbi:MAG: transcriptional regulator, partial [Deltaproteobacteria bacterium HGW-Deltaproteobacteria-11]